MHFRRIPQVFRHAIGVPSLPTSKFGDEHCPICDASKLSKAACGQADSRHATVCNQGLSIDTGFIVQKSNNSARMERLTGLHGETCYVLITDHFSGALYGGTFATKAPPVDYINRWLAKHGRGKDVANKYVRMDLGGDLGKSTDIRNHFEEAGYVVEPTAPDSSHQNGPGERPHRTIKDALRSILYGAGLPLKFWPYTFHHYLRLYNVVPRGTRTLSSFEIRTGSPPDLQYLRTFGCKVSALPARAHRPSSLEHGVRSGLFLGYT